MTAAVEQAREQKGAEEAAGRTTAGPHRFTRDNAAEMARRSQAARAQKLAPPSDEAIETELRRRALTSAKDAEVLLRWQARPRPTPTEGEGIEGMSEDELTTLYAGLLRLAALAPDDLARALANGSS